MLRVLFCACHISIHCFIIEFKYNRILTLYTLYYIYHHHTPEFLIRFEAWAKLAQQWLVCALLGIHLEPIKKESM